MKAAKLTSLSNCAGCAAKLRPDVLAQVLSRLPQLKPSKNVLVGFETSDDAAVYQLSRDLAVVSTVDFFPPVVDDPYAYGQIAAANAMSDIWAMGAKALFALNIVAFPKEQPLEVLEAILAGGADKAAEAGISVLGGHSVQSPEPKYGMAVTGVVHPRKILKNSGGKVGDWLILTKPLGTGIATTAIKQGLATKAMIKQVTAQMSQLNKAAGEVFASGAFAVNALTDVTGFGLLGHLLEMARGAVAAAVIELENLPILPGVPALAERGVVPGGTKTNLEHVKRFVALPQGLPVAIAHVLADAQTNGGLLAAVPDRHLDKALSKLSRARLDSWVIGRFIKGQPAIHVV